MVYIGSYIPIFILSELHIILSSLRTVSAHNTSTGIGCVVDGPVKNHKFVENLRAASFSYYGKILFWTNYAENYLFRNFSLHANDWMSTYK